MEQAAIWAVRQTCSREGRGARKAQSPSMAAMVADLQPLASFHRRARDAQLNPEMLTCRASLPRQRLPPRPPPPSSSADDALHDDSRRTSAVHWCRISGEATPGSRPQWVEGMLPASMLQPLQAGDARSSRRLSPLSRRSDRLAVRAAFDSLQFDAAAPRWQGPARLWRPCSLPSRCNLPMLAPPWAAHLPASSHMPAWQFR